MKPRTMIIIVGVRVITIGSKFLPFTKVPELPPISVSAEVLSRPGGFPLTNSLLMTLLVDVILIGLVVIGTRFGRMQMVPRGLQNIWELSVETFYGLGESIDRLNIRRMFTLVATIFFFVLFSNLLALIPGVGTIGVCRTHEETIVNVGSDKKPANEAAKPLSAEEQQKERNKEIAKNGNCGTDAKSGEVLELVPLLRSPSADLNTTLAIALISFFATEYFGFKDLGFGYLGKFFNTKEGPIMFVVGLLELISEFVRILAFTFRLFGNIFAGEVVLVVMAFLVPWVLPMPFYGFELFVGFIQAFIFAVLTMAFINQSTTAHHVDDGHGGHTAVSPADVAH
ncbi:MAG: F0F1 ATP synthase subunit A [Herpetosiphon sp.]